MRIEGEAPKQQQPILFPGAKTMGGRRAAATSDRFLAVSSLCAPRGQNRVLGTSNNDDFVVGYPAAVA